VTDFIEQLPFLGACEYYLAELHSVDLALLCENLGAEASPDRLLVAEVAI
jgi:hypothetical protein